MLGVHPHCPGRNGPWLNHRILPVWMLLHHLQHGTDPQLLCVPWKANTQILSLLKMCLQDRWSHYHPFAHSDLIDKVQFGDRVNFTGIHWVVAIETVPGWVMWSLLQDPHWCNYCRMDVKHLCEEAEQRLFQCSIKNCLGKFPENQTLMRDLPKLWL